MIDYQAKLMEELRPKRFSLTVLRIDNSPIQVSADTLTELLKKLLLELKIACTDADTLFEDITQEAAGIFFAHVKDD